MDFKVLFSTFAAVFLAEIGDKTQLAVVGLSAGNRSTLSVMTGAVLAMVTATVLGVLAGSWIGDHLPVNMVHKGAGVLFLVIGIFLLIRG